MRAAKWLLSSSYTRFDTSSINVNEHHGTWDHLVPQLCWKHFKGWFDSGQSVLTRSSRQIGYGSTQSMLGNTICRSKSGALWFDRQFVSSSKGTWAWQHTLVINLFLAVQLGTLVHKWMSSILALLTMPLLNRDYSNSRIVDQFISTVMCACVLAIWETARSIAQESGFDHFTDRYIVSM